MRSQFGKSNCITFCIFSIIISHMITLVAINITNKVVSAVSIPLIKLQNLTLKVRWRPRKAKEKNIFLLFGITVC
jgi:hypothetical protein